MRKLYALCADHSRHGGLAVSRQLVEMATLFFGRRIGPGYYQLARFWRRDITFSEKWHHFNEREYRRTVGQLNPSNYQKLSQHKVAEKALLSLFGLPTAAFIGYFHVARGMDAQSQPLQTAAQLQNTLRRRVGQRICFKPVTGHGGISFAALDVAEHDGVLSLTHPLSGRTYSLTEWTDHMRASPMGWMIEAFLEQHPLLAALNPDSLNTLRVIVVASDGKFVTRGVFLRVGRAGSQVDNTSSGGFACPVELATGRVREALDLSPARTRHTTHPDTGAPIVGLQLPYWPDCMRLAERALSIFPRMNFAGVDIAITREGPAVIELNVDPDRRSAAHLDLPHREIFAGAGKL